MNENTDLLPNLSSQEDAFEVQMRGYSRRQVDDFVARCRSQIRELEERLGRALDEGEQLRNEVTSLRAQALGSRPAHEEVSERISQILKLADDEAKAQKNRADDDIKKQLTDARSESDRTKKEAREQAEHMLTAAQEQAERAISSARSEADKTRTTARAEADHSTADARKKADSVLSGAKSQAKQTLDEATARAAAIHDGAERRLNLLSTRHSETIRRLTDILDGVSGLVAAETARPSLEDEVDQHVAKAMGQKKAEAANAGGPSGAGTPNGAPAPGRPGQGTPVGDAAAAAARSQRPGPGAPGGPRPDPAGRPAPGQPGGPGAGAGVGGPGVGGPGASGPGASGPGAGGPGVSGQGGPTGGQPGPGAKPVPDPVLVHPGPSRGAHEAPRGGAHEAPRSRSPQNPATLAPLPADQLRPSGSGHEGEDRGPGRPGGPAHRASGDESNFTGALDQDEPTEGVRIVREQRQH
jgi:cell division septum initiation protein DivIVA